MGKSALSSSSPRAEEQGRGTALAGGGQSGRPGPWRRPGARGKGRWSRFPHLIWAEVACGGTAMVAGGGAALAGATAALQGSAAVRIVTSQNSLS